MPRFFFPPGWGTSPKPKSRDRCRSLASSSLILRTCLRWRMMNRTAAPTRGILHELGKSRVRDSDGTYTIPSTIGRVNVEEPTPFWHFPEPSPPGQLVSDESEESVESGERPRTRVGSTISPAGSSSAGGSCTREATRGSNLLVCLCRRSMMG